MRVGYTRKCLHIRICARVGFRSGEEWRQKELSGGQFKTGSKSKEGLNHNNDSGGRGRDRFKGDIQEEFHIKN